MRRGMASQDDRRHRGWCEVRETAVGVHTPWIHSWCDDVIAVGHAESEMTELTDHPWPCIIRTRSVISCELTRNMLLGSVNAISSQYLHLDGRESRAILKWSRFSVDFSVTSSVWDMTIALVEMASLLWSVSEVAPRAM